jgi:serine/threonine protein kinase
MGPNHFRERLAVMLNTEPIDGETSAIVQDPNDKTNIKIHNILPSIERTFLKIGSTIGKYNIIEEIDRGGMAVVYKALQLDLNREVALKVLPANITINRRFVERFLSEARAVAKLHHPYIVNIHEVAVENNVYYLAMDYIPGRNLYYFLNFQKPKLVDVLEISVKLADALAYAHKQKIIHRDLKLNNIIMRDTVTPVLIDFGLAKALEGEEVALTKTGEIMGSPAYMAPERLSGANTDARSDICSLGIMLYEMLTFKNPYLDPRSMPQTTRNVMEANPILPRKIVPWLPAEIEAITLKAMNKEPDKRYQTMEEFRDDLKRYQKGEPVLANPPSIWSKGKHFWHVYWALLVIGLLFVLFSSLFVFSMYLYQKKERPYWFLSFKDGFDGTGLDNKWTMHPAALPPDTLAWALQQKALRSPGAGYSYIKLDRTFFQDVRIEFDVQAVQADMSDIGFFLGGNCPDSGYCFLIHQGPSARCGIAFPGSDFLFSDIDPLEINTANRYHAVIEKKDNFLLFRLNNKTVATLNDCFPMLGRNHRNMGFFVKDSRCDFDNFMVYTYRLPLQKGPCVLADGLAKHGDAESALDEYEESYPDYSTTDLAGEFLLKMCESHIRLGHYGIAARLLDRVRDSVKTGKDLLPWRLFLEGMVYAKTGHAGKSDSSFSRLLKVAPENPFSQSAGSYVIVAAARAVEQHDLTLAEGILSPAHSNLPGNRKAYGKVFLSIMEGYLEKGDIDRAKTIGNMMLPVFKSEPDVFLNIKVALARAHLASGNTSGAIDLLNQCISTIVPSEAVWRAWLLLAGVYEYESNFTDAFTIYKKIYADCPKYLSLPWMARIKMGEIADRVTSEERSDKIFSSVIASSHPFALPRRIASYYTGGISDEAFKQFWISRCPSDSGYMRCEAHKALIDRKPEEARKFLESFQLSVAPNTWTSMQVRKELSLLQK